MTSLPPESSPTVLEVEQKYRISDPDPVASELLRLGAVAGAAQRHADTYYRHPCRDFAATREALRIRRIADVASGDTTTLAGSSRAYVTYKGPYLPGGIKSRPELEWRIDPCDAGGQNLAELLGQLGFVEALTVTKTRHPFDLDWPGRPVAIVLDDAGVLGHFVEIETIANGLEEVETCRSIVADVAQRLALRQPEPRSYLAMALATPNYPAPPPASSHS